MFLILQMWVSQQPQLRQRIEVIQPTAFHVQELEPEKTMECQL